MLEKSPVDFQVKMARMKERTVVYLKRTKLVDQSVASSYMLEIGSLLMPLHKQQNATELLAAMIISKKGCRLEKSPSPAAHVTGHFQAATTAGGILMKEEGG